MPREPSDVPPQGKTLDGRRNYSTLNRNLPKGFAFASPEEALAEWKRSGCFCSPKFRKIVKRSTKAGIPVCVNITQRETTPDGRSLRVTILTVDTRVTPMP